jgi:maltose alpha-D-glucosyltransferase/alpha-amylase
LLELAEREPPDTARDLLGEYLDSAGLLGRRTAELHIALASDAAQRDFSPQPFTTYYQRSRYQEMRRLTGELLYVLRGQHGALPQALRDQAQAIIDSEAVILDRFKSGVNRKISAVRTRYHGDYHLGQVLCCGGDYVFIDFEGEPHRLMAERHLKASPLRDVAGMIRSFHYAACETLAARKEDKGDEENLDPWAIFWAQQAAAAFLGAYLRAAGDAAFIPRNRKDLAALLDALVLEEAIYDLGYDLARRPDRLPISLQGVLQQIDVEG